MSIPWWTLSTVTDGPWRMLEGAINVTAALLQASVSSYCPEARAQRGSQRQVAACVSEHDISAVALYMLCAGSQQNHGIRPDQHSIIATHSLTIFLHTGNSPTTHPLAAKITSPGHFDTRNKRGRLLARITGCGCSGRSLKIFSQDMRLVATL